MSNTTPEPDPFNLHLSLFGMRFHLDDMQIELCEIAARVLGAPGRMLSGSKSAYRDRHSDHVALFNACLFDEQGVERWFGDIDLTVEEHLTRQLADDLGHRLHLTPEHPFRFDGLDRGGEHYPDDVRSYTPAPAQRLESTPV